MKNLAFKTTSILILTCVFSLQALYSQAVYTIVNISSDYREQIIWNFDNDPTFAALGGNPSMLYAETYPAGVVMSDTIAINQFNTPAGVGHFGFSPGFSRNDIAIVAEWPSGSMYILGYYSFSVDQIYPPENIEASEGYAYDTIRVSWEKGTDVPDSRHGYYIYRDGILHDSVAGDKREYFDPGLALDESHDYTVTTYSKYWGTLMESTKPAAVTGYTVGFMASDGEYQTRTKLTWSNISILADDIRILRSVPNSSLKEELAILNPNATTYNDVDGIPGYKYTYYLEPIKVGYTYAQISDMGFKKPNGVIRGHVKSPLGAGVKGVSVSVEYTGTAPAGGGSTPNCTTKYCATTDASGFYEITNVYYYDSAEFRIVPYKMTNVEHDFTPDTLIRILDAGVTTASGVDFIDETVITVTGKVTYDSDGCSIPNVAILINDEDIGVRSDDSGNWAAAISDPGRYRFRAELYDHTYLTPTGKMEDTLDVSADISGVNFKNVTLRTVNITAQAGCKVPLGDSVEITVTATGGCFQTRKYQSSSAGILQITDLPPRDGYTFDVTKLNPSPANQTTILTQLLELDLDLLQPDSFYVIQDMDSIRISPADTTTLPDNTVLITPADTVLVTYADTGYTTIPSLRFIYRSPIKIRVRYADAGIDLAACPGSPYNGIPVMQKGVAYPLQVELYEDINGSECPIDEGAVIIYDEVSDIPTYPNGYEIENGSVFHTVYAGEPDIAVSQSNNHQKWLYIVPFIDFLPPPAQTEWIFVEGLKSNTPTFTTGTPEIPQLIVHDPPGDNSYAFVEEGTSVTTFTKSSLLIGGDAGLYINTKFGVGGSGFGITAKAGAAIEFEAKAGRNNLDEEGYYTTVSFTESFSTSSLENFTSGDGDVYIGSAINQTFAISEELTLDQANANGCMAEIDSVLDIGLDGFETTFIYTEKHIVNTLLPQLATLMSIVVKDTMNNNTNKMLFNQYRADSLSWASIVAQNQQNRDDATGLYLDQGNVSISAGATLSRTYASTTGASTSYEYDIFFDTNLKLGAEVEVASPGGYFEFAGGVMAHFQTNTQEVESENSDTLRTVGYVISDNDIGDFITFDIYKDPDYDVPIFRTISGTTSCPNEPGTQPRDVPKISIFPSVRSNIPVGGTGNFRCDVANLSQSGEAREYHVRVISATNPDGALVRLGGSLINFSPASVFIAPGQTIQFTLTVDAGPLASDYSGIEIMVYPPCEYDLWQDGGDLINADTFAISAFFESACTNVSLVNPTNNWLVNQNSNNTLQVTFGGFDINNMLLESLTLWIKPDGGGYQKAFVLDTPNILAPFHDIYLDVSQYSDGGYTLRASAECGIGVGRTYSGELHGFIDRNSLAPFGTPSPADGFLRPGQDIKVTFDKAIDPIDLSGVDTVLYRMDTGEPIAFTTQISGNEIILKPDTNLIDRPELAGVTVAARVDKLKDLNGNVQAYPVDWSFLVNVDPVFWDPSALTLVSYEGKPFSFKGRLKNDSHLAKQFSLNKAQNPMIVSYPDWLTPVQKSGTILANSSYDVEFVLDPSLSPGIYNGLVIAAVDGDSIELNVTIERLATPVTWQFDPSAFEYSMTIVAQFSLDSTNIPLSTDTRDVIAAFVEGEIRGITNIEYLPGPSVYRAFLTIYSNIPGGGGAEPIKFRFWRALTGVEYGAVEQLEFLLNHKEGSIAAPYILHPNGTFQVIPLRQGWNWISFNVLETAKSRESVFESIIKMEGGNSIIVKHMAKTCEYSPGSGWNGNLQLIEVGKGYMIYLSDYPDTLYVVGNPVTTQINRSVVSGWNWIGYPKVIAKPVDTVLQDLVPLGGDLLKSQSQFAEYHQATSAWEGSLKHFEPNKGYKIKLGTSGTIIFRNGEYQVDRHEWEFNMNVTGYVDLDMIETSGMDNLTIGAFIDGQCRGVASVDASHLEGGNRVFLLVSGMASDIGKPVEFKVRDDASSKEFVANGDAVEFLIDGLVGRALTPYQFFRSEVNGKGGHQEFELFQNQPNPARDQTVIGFSIPKASEVVFTFIDARGVEVLSRVKKDLPAGAHTLHLDIRDLAPGIYYYKLTSDEFSAVKTFVKQ